MTNKQASFMAIVTLTLGASVALAQSGEFPFERELILDVNPMRGAKRVPILEFAGNGVVTIDLWCNTVKARAEIIGDTISIDPLPETTTRQTCAPERARADEELLATLAGIRQWRLGEQALTLVGPTTLRFRFATN